MRCNVFSTCGKLVGHFPDFGWLRAATGGMKRRLTAVTKRWDDTENDIPIKQMMAEIACSQFLRA